jgi:tetratricopeptide (TPR) repeat protein
VATRLVASLLLAGVLVAGCSGREARTARFLDHGKALLEAGKPEKARVELRNALQLSPNNANVRYQNALVEEQLADYPRALSLYQAAIDADPALDAARARLARLYMFGNEAEQALIVLNAGLTARPDSVPLLAIRAAVKARLQDPAGAIEDGEHALRISPSDEVSAIVVAGLYSANNRVAEARALLESAVTRLPASADLREVLAQFYAAQGELPKTEQALIDLVKLKPRVIPARTMLARFYVGIGRIDAAEQVMRKAMADFPDQSALREAFVQLLAEKRGLAAAEAELRSMIAAKPKERDLQFLLGRYLEQDKQFEQAEALYRTIIESEGKRSAGLVARDRLAALFLQQGRAAEVIRPLVADVLAENPRDEEALRIRSGLYLAANDAKSAIVDLRALARDHPENVGVQRQLARAYLMSGDGQLGEDLLKQLVANDPKDAAARSDLVQYYLQLGRPLQARALADQLVQLDPKNVDYQQAAFRAAVGGMDFVAAATAVSAVEGATPERPLGPFLAGVLAESQGKGEEAVRQYRRSLDLDPAAQDPLGAAIRQLVLQKKADKALQLVDDINAKVPGYGFGLNLRGELLAGLQRWPEAAASFEAAAKATPHSWLPYRNLALLRMAQKDPEGALLVLKDAAGKAEQTEPVTVDLAMLLQRLGRQDEAIAAYESLIARHPESDVGANNLAMLLIATRSDAASLRQANDLVARFAQSKNADYLDTRGWVLLKLGRAPEAVPVLEQAVAMAPEEGATRYHLALAQFEAGRKQVALDNLERALQSNKDFEGIADARARLAEWKRSS